MNRTSLRPGAHLRVVAAAAVLGVLGSGCSTVARGVARQSAPEAVSAAVEEGQRERTSENIQQLLEDPNIAEATREFGEHLGQGLLRAPAQAEFDIGLPERPEVAAYAEELSRAITEGALAGLQFEFQGRAMEPDFGPFVQSITFYGTRGVMDAMHGEARPTDPQANEGKAMSWGEAFLGGFGATGRWMLIVLAIGLGLVVVAALVSAYWIWRQLTEDRRAMARREEALLLLVQSLVDRREALPEIQERLSHVWDRSNSSSRVSG